MRWRLLLTPARSGADNMALDDALLARARDTGEAVLRVYTWTRPTLSLGRNQTARGLYDADRARAAGIDIVRRPTGGRAVLHHREVTYSITAPADDAGSLRESYDRINRLLLEGLRALGVDARLAEPAGRAPAPGAAPCFEEPTAGELVLGGRKLVGSAQVRDDGALLQHGSILIDDDQALASSLLVHPLPPPPPPATLRAALGRAPSVEEVAGSLFRAVRALEDPGAGVLVPAPALEDAARRARARYEDDRWTWRR